MSIMVTNPSTYAGAYVQLTNENFHTTSLSGVSVYLSVTKVSCTLI